MAYDIYLPEFADSVDQWFPTSLPGFLDLDDDAQQAVLDHASDGSAATIHGYAISPVADDGTGECFDATANVGYPSHEWDQSGRCQHCGTEPDDWPVVATIRVVGEGVRCPDCAGAAATARHRHVFRYGADESAVDIAVELPVRRCGACGFEFLDEEGERLKHEALCRYLRLLAQPDAKQD